MSPFFFIRWFMCVDDTTRREKNMQRRARPSMHIDTPEWILFSVAKHNTGVDNAENGLQTHKHRLSKDADSVGKERTESFVIVWLLFLSPDEAMKRRAFSTLSTYDIYVRPRKTVMPHNGSRPHSRSEWSWAYNSGACVPCVQYNFNHTTTKTVVVQYTRSERAQNNRTKKRLQSTASWSSVSSLEMRSVTAKTNSKTHIGTHTDSGVDQRIMTSRLHC